MNFTAEGLVLRVTGVGEHDRSLSILAMGRGRITAWANGSRRMRSHILSGSQLFSFARFTLYERRGRYIVNAAELIDSFFGLQKDINALALASYLAELMAALTDEGVPCDDLLRAGLNALHLLSRGQGSGELIKGAAELRMLALSGYMPDLIACRGCGKFEGCMTLDLAEACLWCKDCAPQDAVEGRLAQLAQGSLTAMRHAIYAQPKKLYSFALPEDTSAQFASACEAYTLYTLGRSFNTLNFLHSL